MSPAFRIPLNLSHACKVAVRIQTLIAQYQKARDLAFPRSVLAVGELIEVLFPFHMDDTVPRAEALAVRDNAAVLARKLVDALVSEGLTGDRMGQCIRNLFECLELGEEGFHISLRAGENPDSLQRPVD